MAAWSTACGSAAAAPTRARGSWRWRARAIVGPKCVIGVELDPHCHLTMKRVSKADIIVLYKEFPHTDVVERAEDLLDLVLRTFCTPGDAVVVTTPSYHQMFGLLKAHGLQIVPVAFGGVLLDMSGMSRVLAIDAEALTVRTEAGIFWHSLAEELRRENLGLALPRDGGTRASVVRTEVEPDLTDG